MSMIIAGVMSGTSADGINVALVRVASDEALASGPSPHKQRADFTLIAHEEYPFPAPIRRAILGMMNAELARVADLARLNFLLGELYAEAVAKTARKHRVKLDLVGCHGQTLYHQGEAGRFLGRKLAVTWQTGEGAVIYASACAGCHQGPRAVPYGGIDLALSSAISGPNADNLVNVVLNGLPAAAGARSGIMPGFAATLNDRQLVALANYLRGRFSDKGQWQDVDKSVRDGRSGRRPVI